MARPDHVFIVGLARTGSTLTRSSLNASDELGIAGESHFFRDVPRVGSRSRRSYRHRLREIGDIRTDSGAKAVVNYIFNTEGAGFWNLRAKNVDHDEFLRRLLETDRSERSLFDLAMSCQCNGKPIRGEKTPAHIYYVPTLLEWFPDAKVIHTFRDPRGIYVSNRKKSSRKTLPWPQSAFRKLGLVFELYSSLNAILTWVRVIRLHHRYRQLYPNSYYLFRFEDLVVDPRATLQGLCNFLEVDFSEAMLHQTVINSSYLPRGQVQGFDTTAIYRWREHIHPLINRWFILWCKPHLLEFGYQL